MRNIKSFDEYLTEKKSLELRIKNISRHLAFDKDIIKYLNTSKSKREIGWRDLLNKKLTGDNLNYVNYITKNMVTNLNPNNITGPTSVTYTNDEDDKDSVELDNTLNNQPAPNELEIINNRLKDIEDTLGIDPDESETVDDSKEIADELGFKTIMDDESESEEDEEE